MPYNTRYIDVEFTIVQKQYSRADPRNHRLLAPTSPADACTDLELVGLSQVEVERDYIELGVRPPAEALDVLHLSGHGLALVHCRVGPRCLHAVHLRLGVPAEVAGVRLHAVGLFLADVGELERLAPQRPLVPVVLWIDVLLYEMCGALHPELAPEGVRHKLDSPQHGVAVELVLQAREGRRRDSMQLRVEIDDFDDSRTRDLFSGQ